MKCGVTSCNNEGFQHYLLEGRYELYRSSFVPLHTKRRLLSFVACNWHARDIALHFSAPVLPAFLHESQFLEDGRVTEKTLLYKQTCVAVVKCEPGIERSLSTIRGR